MTYRVCFEVSKYEYNFFQNKRANLSMRLFKNALGLYPLYRVMRLKKLVLKLRKK